MKEKTFALIQIIICSLILLLMIYFVFFYPPMLLTIAYMSSIKKYVFAGVVAGDILFMSLLIWLGIQNYIENSWSDK